MSDKKVSLALTFLEKHPLSAARILEQHDTKVVAEFFADTPYVYVTPVIKSMLPHFTADICKQMDIRVAADLLSSLEASRIVTVLRYMGRERKNGVLAGFSTKTRTACNLLLRFSTKTVGAWMTPLIPTIPDDYLIKNALHAIRSAKDLEHQNYVFVVNRDRFLKGCIHYADLLLSDPELPIQLLLDKNCSWLTGNTPISHALKHHDWEHVDVMPVLNRKGQFIGAIRHVDLRKGLEHITAFIDQQSGQESLNGIAQIYAQTLLAIFHTVINLAEQDIKR